MGEGGNCWIFGPGEVFGGAGWEVDCRSIHLCFSVDTPQTPLNSSAARATKKALRQTNGAHGVKKEKEGRGSAFWKATSQGDVL